MTLAVGVDLGGTNLRAALVDTLAHGGELPALQHELRLELAGDTAPESVAARLAQAVETVAKGAPHAPVGIGVAGMLRGDTGVVANAPNLGWRDVDFRALLTVRLPTRRIELHNDVNAIAFGEHAFGAGRGVPDALCVFVGTGLGAGLVAGGILIKGATHVAAELGHVKVVVGPDARPCGCGARGCIEAYVGGQKLQERARVELRAGARSRAVELAGGADRVHPGHLDQAAREGDAYASGLWGEIAPLLGLVLANAVTTLNPGRLILGGGVLWGAPELKRLALAAYRELCNAPSREACQVVDAALGDAAGILGAAALAALA
jgi:glucokinase